MRKIISKYEEKKKKRRNQFVVGGILIVVMLVSVLGYAFPQGQVTDTGSSNITTTYNGVTFTSQNGFWSMLYRNQRLAFSYNPSQINSNLTAITKTINDFAGKSVYVYSEDNNAQSELSYNLAKFSNIVPLQNLSEKDCSNNEIIIQNSSTNSINQEQNCIFISGQGQDLIASTDNVFFKLLGVKQ